MAKNKWSDYELLFIKNEYNNLSINEIALKLNRSINAIKKKSGRLNLIKHYKPNISKDILSNIVKDSNNIGDVLMKLNKIKTGDSYKIIKKYIKLYNIDITHFNKIKKNNKRIETSNILVENSNYCRRDLKNRLYNEGLKQRNCELCGQGEEWNGKYMSLILDHINGIHDDNRIENLRIVCPNCNATLDTHCGKNIKNKSRYVRPVA